MTQYTILVGVDFTPESDEAVRHGLRVAAFSPQFRLHFATVLDAAQSGDDVLAGHTEAQLATAERELIWRVSGVASAEGDDAPVDLSFHVGVGDAAESLSQLAFDLGADLLVVGASRLPGSLQRFLGTVGQSLFTDGRFPVLVARTSDLVGLVHASYRTSSPPGAIESAVGALDRTTPRGTTEPFAY